MRSSDLEKDDINAIDRVAMLLYTSKPGGYTAVYDLATALRWEEFGVCELCDDDGVPVLDGMCMICGNEITIKD